MLLCLSGGKFIQQVSKIWWKYWNQDRGGWYSSTFISMFSQLHVQQPRMEGILQCPHSFGHVVCHYFCFKVFSSHSRCMILDFCCYPIWRNFQTHFSQYSYIYTHYYNLPVTLIVTVFFCFWNRYDARQTTFDSTIHDNCILFQT